MGTRSFFVESGTLHGERVDLTGQVAHQVRNVLRLGEGDTIELLDGSGLVYPARILGAGRDVVSAELGEGRRSHAEPRVAVDLYQSMLKGEKMELVLQKGTEIGVARFVPVLSERCVSRPTARDLEKKLPRWKAIVREAAEQSGRAVLPEVAPLMTFEEACRRSVAAGPAMIAWEAEVESGLSSAVAQAGLTSKTDEAAVGARLSLLVGPEGGFSPREAAVARESGVRVVSLGPRILRAETAALVSAALALGVLGEMGG